MGRKKCFVRRDFSVAPAGAFSVGRFYPQLALWATGVRCSAAWAGRNLWRKFFAVRLVVAVPAGQGGVAGVGKKKWQRRRFDVAVAKHHVGFALMT
jgi:hypothetical protein